MYLERTFGMSSIQKLVFVKKRPSSSNSNNNHVDNDDDDEEENTALHQSTSVEQLVMTYTKDPFWNRINSVLALFPVAVGLFVASSRLVDNVHFPADVVGGSILGASVAISVFRIWYVKRQCWCGIQSPQLHHVYLFASNK
jgi:hypothetical protein